MIKLGQKMVLVHCKRCQQFVNRTDTRFASSSVDSSKDVQAKKAVNSSSFVQNIFRGLVSTEQIFPYPEVLNAEQKGTLEMLIPATQKFFDECNDPMKNDSLGYVPEETIKGMQDLGAFGMQVPNEYGGVGLTNTQYGRLSEIIGMSDLGIAVFMGAHQSIGFKGILIGGTDAQKAKYLPNLASGKTLAAFTLTEPASGSDASSIKTRAELGPDGKTWILNGSKIWITNGGIAEIFTVFAKTPVADQKTGSTVDKVTAFIVERSFGGVTHGQPENKMGIRCSNTCEVYFDNTPVPAENILGGLGNGFKMAMQILNNGRFGMGTSLAGTMRGVITKAVDHARNRTQFGSKIETYGTIQEKIARMSIVHYTTESIGYMISGIMDKGFEEYQLEAAISKIYASEAAWYVTDEAIQIMGGMGFMVGNGLEKILRDLRIFRIFEGTNDILRLFVALTGIQYAGGHLKELQKVIQDPISNFGVVMGEVAKRGKSAIGIKASNVLAENVHPSLSDSAALVCISVELFGKSVEKLLIQHGKGIINEQFLLNRLANSAIDIFAMACNLSRCTKSLNAKADSGMIEQMMTKTFCNEAYIRINKNLIALKSPEDLEIFKNLADISKAVCQNTTPVQSNPLGL